MSRSKLDQYCFERNISVRTNGTGALDYTIEAHNDLFIFTDRIKTHITKLINNDHLFLGDAVGRVSFVEY